MRHARSILLCLGALGLPAVALAQGAAAAEPKVTYQKKTEVTFEKGSDVNGTVYGPDGTILKAKPKVNFRNLIEIRTNFRQEILQSASAL